MNFSVYLNRRVFVKCTFSALAFLSRFHHQMGRTKQKDVSGHMRKRRHISDCVDAQCDLCFRWSLTESLYTAEFVKGCDCIVCVWWGGRCVCVCVWGGGGVHRVGENFRICQRLQWYCMCWVGVEGVGVHREGEKDLQICACLKTPFHLTRLLCNIINSATEVLTNLLISPSLICFCELGSGVFSSNI